MPSQLQSRAQIVKIGKMLHQCGYIAACDGNLSIRLNRNEVLVTPKIGRAHV